MEKTNTREEEKMDKGYVLRASGMGGSMAPPLQDRESDPANTGRSDGDTGMNQFISKLGSFFNKLAIKLKMERFWL